MNPTLGMTFMISTMLIAVPSAIKVFNWMGTMWRGNITFHVPMLHAVGFVAMFVIGGLSGVFMANTPIDIYIHDTYFIVAHIHYVLFGGSLFALFAAITFWYPKMFGRLMNPFWGKVHFWLTMLFYNLVFFPMHTLGLFGHMRRIYDPTRYDFLKPMQPLNEFISIAAFLLFATQIIFALMFIISWFTGETAGPNPWKDTGLEWTTPSPAPHGNFPRTPTVYHPPYEFSVPLLEEDFLPQDRNTDATPQPASRPARH
jgi:cytochrome c oxidase subunit 1